jgi:hypothetical protein
MLTVAVKPLYSSLLITSTAAANTCASAAAATSANAAPKRDTKLCGCSVVCASTPWVA